MATSGIATRASGGRQLAPRLISAAIGLPLLLLAVWAGVPWFTAVAVAAAALGAIELANLARHRGDRPSAILAGLLAGALVGWAHFLAPSQWTAAVMAPVMLVVAAASLAWMLWDRRRGAPLTSAIATVCAAGYVGGLLFHAPLLRAADQGLQWVLFLLLVTFATDSASFAVGKAMGRHKLAPSLSPGKTWEGSAGGALGALAAGLALWQLLSLEVGVAFVLIMSMLAGTLGQVGDLAESRLKRLAGVKDSGRLVPGHGGILDRLDSLIWNLPVIYYVMLWSTQ